MKKLKNTEKINKYQNAIPISYKHLLKKENIERKYSMLYIE